MRNKNTTRGWLAFLLASALTAPGAVSAQPANNPSRQYDASARETMSPNDVKAFVHQWFAAFDHQADISVFLRHIDPKRVDMAYPDFPILSIDDFRRWYGGVVDNVAWNSHDIRNLAVTGSETDGFGVSLDVCWRARTYDGATPLMLVHQDWRLTVAPGGRLVFNRMRANASGPC